MVLMGYVRSSSHPENAFNERRPSKRISTPAGRRLSIVLDSERARSKPLATPAPLVPPEINVSTTSTYCNDPKHQHIEPVQYGEKRGRISTIVTIIPSEGINNTSREESIDVANPNASQLSISVWSDRDPETFGLIRRGGGITEWRWKKLAMLSAIVLAVVLALALGLALGSKKKSSNSSSTGSNLQPTSNTNPSSPSKPLSTLTPPAPPPNFPAGSYSFVGFLDTVSTGCTSNPSTWTCAPFTDYYTSPQKALTIFNWEISGSPGSFKISSKGQDSTFGVTLQNEAMELLDAGQDQERYHFQISRPKSVNMTGSLGKTNGDFVCDFGTSSVQAALYTKMQRTYPKDNIMVSGNDSPAWPYAVKIEQTVAGGQGVPACKSTSGTSVTGGITPQDSSTLCSCLYKNWTPQT